MAEGVFDKYFPPRRRVSLVTFTRVTSGRMQFIFTRRRKEKGREAPLSPLETDPHLANYLLSRISRIRCSISVGRIRCNSVSNRIRDE